MHPAPFVTHPILKVQQSEFVVNDAGASAHSNSVQSASGGANSHPYKYELQSASEVAICN